jgi:pilus assembly protein CpaF
MATPTRTVEQMNMFGVDIDKRIFDAKFEMSREMLIEELEKDLPSKMCGWKNENLDVFMQRDSSFFLRWPHFQHMY